MSEQPRTPLPEEFPMKDKKEKYLSDDMPYQAENSDGDYRIALCFVKPYKDQNYWELYSESRFVDAVEFLNFSENMKTLVEGIVEDFLIEVFSSENQYEATVAYRTGEAA